MPVDDELALKPGEGREVAGRWREPGRGSHVWSHMPGPRPSCLFPSRLKIIPYIGRIALQKIGVLTFHRCINYGSYWQARCLVEGLKARGVNAVLLEHCLPRINRAEWRCAMQPTLPVPTTMQDRSRYGRKIRKFFDAFTRLPLSSSFSLDDPASMEEYSTIVIGSDEVWNLKHPWYGGQPLFYGDGLRTDRIVSYAASFGNFNSSERLTRPWQEKLRRLSAISVRDYNSYRLLRNVLGISPKIVLDPCLQFPEVVQRNSAAATESAPYIAVYGHSFPCWFQQHVRRWAQENARRLVSIGYRNDWADEQRIEAGPDEFAGLIASADVVATNFFHGCVFSLVNDKPFVCCLSDYRSNKLQDLAKLVGADLQVVGEDTAFGYYEQALGTPVEPWVDSNIRDLRAQSYRYLDDVLA
jgi:hypothetical protein